MNVFTLNNTHNTCAYTDLMQSNWCWLQSLELQCRVEKVHPHFKRRTSCTLPHCCPGLPKHGLFCHACIWSESGCRICLFLFLLHDIWSSSSHGTVRLISYLQLFLFYMWTINVKLLETVSRGGPTRTKACCPDLLYSAGTLNHYFSDRKYLPLGILVVKCIFKMKWFLFGRDFNSVQIACLYTDSL